MTTTTIAELPYLARRVLRIVAKHGSVCLEILRRSAALNGADLREQTNLLLALGLVTREGVHHNFVITDAGRECAEPHHVEPVLEVVAAPQKAAPRTFVRAGSYSGAELGYRGMTQHATRS